MDLTLETVAQAAVPIQMISVVTPPAPKRKAPKRRLQFPVGSDDEIVAKESDVVDIGEQQWEKSTVDDVDKIIEMVLTETEQMEIVMGESDMVTEHTDMCTERVLADIEHSTSVNDDDDNLDGDENEIAKEMAYFTAPKQFLKEPLRSGEGEDISGVEQPITAEGPTRIKFGLGIQIPGVSEVDPYTASLSQIAATDKGKENLVEDTIQGHQACQIFSLICADIDFLVQLLTVLGSTEDITAKEKRVLSWADTDSVLIALQRRVLIIAKYRELLLQKFIEARRHNFISGVDYWRSITRPVDSRTWELLPQRPFNDDLAPLCAFIEPVQDLASRSPFSRVVRDLWAEVCIVFVQFSLIGALRPVGTVNYCRDIVGPIVDIEEIPTVFRRVFQCVYCSPSPISTPLISSQGADPTASGVQKDTTLVATEPGVQIQPVSVTTDPTIQIAPVLGSMDQVVQMETNSEPIDRTIQFKANHNPGTPGSGILSPRHTDTIFNSPHTSTSSDSHLRFIADDIPQGDNHILLYAQNLIESFAQLRRSINHIQFEQIRQKDDGEHLKDMILMEIRSLEKKLTEILEQQDSLYRGLFKNVHQEIQIQKTALSLDILIAQRKLSTQHIAVVTGLDDIRKDVKDQKAALSTELEDRLAAVSNDLLDFCVQTQETYNNLSSQLGELVAYINRGVNERKGEGSQQPPTGDRGRSGEDSRSGGDRSGSSSSGPLRRDDISWLRGK
ncbi:splicing factor 3B subunit 1-like [Dorcoceras hygrometricum]|uniref:Splicing factor 3B subunit 1-like n=1 Tax=Dorcoceras hygrometricum TaxID=472368 RepID=A0A2Z7BGL5_9LAMI|nr:splicing factor 3B subunit 1-like [Dorcoceras hygrometricum]